MLKVIKMTKYIFSEIKTLFSIVILTFIFNDSFQRLSDEFTEMS